MRENEDWDSFVDDFVIVIFVSTSKCDVVNKNYNHTQKNRQSILEEMNARPILSRVSIIDFSRGSDMNSRRMMSTSRMYFQDRILGKDVCDLRTDQRLRMIRASM